MIPFEFKIVGIEKNCQIRALKGGQWSYPENQRAWVKVNYNLSTILEIISDPEMPEPGERLTRWMCVHPFLSVARICSSTEEVTHWLDGCPPFLVSGSNLLKNSRATHKLDGCSPFLVSGSDLLKNWRATHSLDECPPVLVSRSDLIMHWRGDSHTGWVVTRSCRRFWTA